MSVNSANRELESGPGRPGHGLLFGFPGVFSSFTSGHGSVLCPDLKGRKHLKSTSYVVVTDRGSADAMTVLAKPSQTGRRIFHSVKCNLFPGETSNLTETAHTVTRMLSWTQQNIVPAKSGENCWKNIGNPSDLLVQWGSVRWGVATGPGQPRENGEII